MSAMAPTYEDRAVEFAAAVRAQLADLPADELDELLDGLQADLAERLADGGELGDPALYADELRQAAGLPPRGSLDAKRPRRSLSQALGEWWADLGRGAAGFFDATPARRGVRDFAVSLRPLWWVARGLVLAWLIMMIGSVLSLGYFTARMLLTFPAFVLATALVIVSVQWGRGMWAPKRWIVVLRRVGSAIAAILLLPGLIAGWAAMNTPEYVYYEYSSVGYPEGLSLNGEQISNIFAYDCTGSPIDAVQLYDQRGNPITTQSQWGAIWGFDEATGEDIIYGPNGLALGDTWNSFPLSEGRGTDVYGVPPSLTEPSWPFAERAPLSASCTVAEAEAQAQTGDTQTGDTETGTGAETDGTAEIGGIAGGGGS